MLISLLIYVLYGVIYGLLYITILQLPDVTANSFVTAAISTIAPYTAVINLVIPLDTIFQIFVASVGIFLVLAIYRIVLWVLKLIRGM